MNIFNMLHNSAGC